MGTILGADGLPLQPVGRRVAQTNNPPPYRAGDAYSQDLAGFRPAIGHSATDWAGARDTAVGRGRYLVRNEGPLRAALQRAVEMMFGPTYRPALKPDYRALGLDAVWAEEYELYMESRWRTWAEDPRFYCDVRRQGPVTQLFATAYRHTWGDGEGLMVGYWLPERGGTHSTAFMAVSPDRLSNPNWAPDSEFLRSGIEYDHDGAAQAYHIRNAHPSDGLALAAATSWERVARESEWGRPQVLHYFRRDDSELLRGVSRLVGIIEPSRMGSEWSRTELQQAILAAAIDTYIESPLDSELVSGMLQDGGQLGAYQEARLGFHDARDIRLGGVRIPTLFPGEKIGSRGGSRPSKDYEPFEQAINRKLAVSIGQTLETFTGDWSRTNYSSSKAAAETIWRGIFAERAEFNAAICQPVLLCFAEEEFASGRVPLPMNAPDFYDNIAAYTRCLWVGGGRGYVDRVKEVNGAQMAIEAGLSTLEAECASQGTDWRDVLDQQAKELEYRRRHNLPLPAWAGPPAELQPES
jgi:lambda family phage portal protein